MTPLRKLRLALVLGILLFAAGDARAIIIIGGLEGSQFVGIFQSSVDMSDVGTFDVFIDSVKNRSFTCRLQIHSVSPPEPEAIPCQGTLSAAGVFEVIARRGVFQVHGKLEANGIANAHYRLGKDEGALLLLQQRQGQAPDPGVFGMFDGDFMSMTTMMDGGLMLDVSRDSQRGNGLMMVTQETVDAYQMPVTNMFAFDVFISNLPPGPCTGDRLCMKPFSMIGLSTMGDPGVFVVMGSHDAGGAMGEYMFFPMGIANADVMDMGTFDLARSTGDVIAPPR